MERVSAFLFTHLPVRLSPHFLRTSKQEVLVFESVGEGMGLRPSLAGRGFYVDCITLLLGPLRLLLEQEEAQTLRQRVEEDARSSKANGDAKVAAAHTAAAAAEEASLMRDELDRALQALASSEASRVEGETQLAEFKQV